MKPITHSEPTGDVDTVSTNTFRDAVLFTSPKAGSGAARDQIPRLHQLLGDQGIACELCSDPGQLRQLVRDREERGEPHPVVIAAGGDGTLSLVAANTTPDTPLVPMPMGTENLLARYFGHRNDAESVWETIRDGRETQLDAGVANRRLYLIMATVGFDAEVVRQLHLRRKGHIWRLSYFKPIIKTLFRYRFPKLRVSAWRGDVQVADRRTAGWAMVFNLPRYAAGLNIEPEAVGDDGLLDLITFEGRSILSGIGYLFAIVTGRHRGWSDIRRDRVTKILIEPDSRVAYQLDGDYAGKLRLEIETLPGRVRLLIPAS